LINAKKAYQIKLVDLYAPEAFFEERLQAFLKSVKEPSKQRILKERRKKYKWMSRLVESNILGRHLIFKKTREMLQKQTQGHYPAPLVAIDVLEETYDKTKLTEGLKIEAEAFAPLPGNPVCQNLVRLFFVREELKKNLGVKTTAKLPEISHAAVLGAGTMGGGIAWLFSSKNIPVLMKDLTWEAVRLGYQTASGIYDQLIKIKKYKPAQVNVKMHAITGTVDYAGFENTDIVVEAIVEDMAIKKSVLAKLEGNVSKSTILATNTSALSVTEMATDLKRPAKFIGMHFFNPVNRMPLVEVIPGEKTSKATIAATVALCKRLGKTPIVVQNCPGFLVNRVLIPYVNEAAFLLVEGVAINHLDSLVKSFGLPMGPFSLADVVGLDVGYKVAHILEEGFGERMAVAPILKILVEEHHVLGQKNGNGFYRGLRSQRSENPKVKSVVQSFQKANGIQKSLISDHDLLDRCILIMANEAARCIEESIVEKPGYLDMAMIMGAGFPPFRGGLLRYIDERGVGTVVERLQQLATKYDERFKPCELLKEMAEKGHLFYS
jgi:3-hydroxyacyl-CoA dehydrogenase/enoyl-CoA hydratase/3-hydroxybutyryl-CoA epimerase